MKNKHAKHPNHLPTVHVRIERFFRHRTFLAMVLSFMALGLIKYQTHMLAIVHDVYYGQGVGLVSSYAHHQEITRMPINYGNNIRRAPISSE